MEAWPVVPGEPSPFCQEPLSQGKGQSLKQKWSLTQSRRSEGSPGQLPGSLGKWGRAGHGPSQVLRRRARPGSLHWGPQPTGRPGQQKTVESPSTVTLLPNLHSPPHPLPSEEGSYWPRLQPIWWKPAGSLFPEEVSQETGSDWGGLPRCLTKHKDKNKP